MRISRVEITNFKSYSGVQVIGPFDQHFSCIIGPNGNGKSNIIDALLFVFGFRSNKLRQDKLSLLIHNSAYAQPTFAQVAVVFSHQQQIKVSRNILKNGQSNYYLNDDKISWGDLKQYLLANNIDLDKNLFIILQGEVEKLCQLTPNKLIEHLEYISGSDTFQNAIQEAQKQYIDVGVKRDNCYSLFTIKNKIYKQTTQSIKQVVTLAYQKLKCLQLNTLIISKQIHSNQKTKHELQQKLLSQNNNIQNIKNQRENKTKQLQKLNQSKCQKNNHKKVYEQKLLEIQNCLSQYSRIKSEIDRKINYVQKDIQRKQKQINLCNKEIKDIKNLTNSNQTILKKYQNLNLAIQNINTSDYQQYYSFYNLSNSQKEIEENIRSSELLKDKLQLKIIQFKKQIQQNNLKKQEINVTQLKVQLTNLHKTQYQLKQKIQVQQQNLQIVKGKIRRSTLQSQNLNKVQKIINEIKMAKQIGLLKGIIGTLRQCVLISTQYQNIINMIFPQLDFVIVQTFEDAKSASLLLANRKIGRSTFLVKDYIQNLKLKWDSQFQTPPHTKRIFDLCKPISQEFKKILFWCIGNTLLADNLDVAMKVAFGQPRQRVITKKGQFIDITGTMTKFSERQQVRDSTEILEKKVKIIENNILKMNQQKENLMKRRETITHLLNQAQNIKSKQQKQQITKQNIQELEDNINDIQKNIKIKQQNLKNIRDQLSKIKNLFKNKHQFNKNLQKIIEYQALSNKIKKIKSSQKIINQLTKQVQDKVIQIKLFKQNIQIQIQSLDSLSQKITHKNNQIKDLQKIIHKIYQQLQFIEQREFIIGTNVVKKSQLDCKVKISKLNQQILQIQEQNLKKKQQDQKYKQQIEYLDNLIMEQINQQLTDYKNSDRALFYLGQKKLTFSELKEKTIFDSISESTFKKQYISIKQKIQVLQQKIRLQDGIFQQFKKLKTQFLAHKNELKELEDKKQQLKIILIELRNKRVQCFMKAFTQINCYLKSIYRQLTGGDAELSLVNTFDPFQGAQFTVRPVNKSWKSVNLLSGGQKTMTSLSLIFACEQIKKFPFYFMDEIDAALDYRNTSLLAKYIKSQTNTQHIVISLRKNMYQESNSLIGVYKVKDQTYCIFCPMKQLLNS